MAASSEKRSQAHSTGRPPTHGIEHIPSSGPALLVCNRLEPEDGALVRAAVPRRVLFVIDGTARERWTTAAAHGTEARLVATDDAHALQGAIEGVRDALAGGQAVCLALSGTVSRTGVPGLFGQAFARIISGLDVTVIPVCIDGVAAPPGVHIGSAVSAPVTPAHVRLAVQELDARAASTRHPETDTLARQFVRRAKRDWAAFSMADSTGRSLTNGRVLVASLLLARWIRRRAADQTNIGLLLPSSVGGALANVATALAGKVAVNLNFTIGQERMALAIERAGIRTILTSRVFLDKVGIEPAEGMVFLEDLLRSFGAVEKLATLAAAKLLPAWAINRWFVAAGPGVDDLACILFSSGSTGVPKGVTLSHRNILSNLESISQLFTVTRKDVLIGALPFFHSFGFTGTLWFPLIGGFGVVYHPNPMDAKTIGELAGTHKATFLMATPTFCAAYVRKCEVEQFAHLRYAIVGAEKLRESVAAAFREKFGVSLLEGYGCTETAPVVAVNRPNDDGSDEQGWRPGTVGQPIPGTVAKVVDPTTGEGPLFDQDGLLLVNGPNRMLGYLHEESRTRDVLRDGYYVTGDIARIDQDGFITITDRLARFSKIGGEMVPHMKVEDVLSGFLDPAALSVITAVPDDLRGERLVAFYTDPNIAPHDVWQKLCDSDLPRLWLPKRDDIHLVDAIPLLGTGKYDLGAVRQLALTTKAAAR